MDLSIGSAKRKAEESDEENSLSGIPNKSRNPNFSGTQESNSGKCNETPVTNLKVVLTGIKRPMKHWRPTVIKSCITKTIGSNYEIRLLPSGDLLVTCKQPKQVSSLLDRDMITDGSNNIPLKTSLYKERRFQSRAVVYGVPIDMSEVEMVEYFANEGVVYAKRLKRKSEKGYVDSLCMMLGFSTNEYPSVLYYDYLKFHTKPYNPPPMRCFQCNRFGHTGKNCGGKYCCCKCGSRNHTYENCTSEKKCVNCKGNHTYTRTQDAKSTKVRLRYRSSERGTNVITPKPKARLQLPTFLTP